jgi:hypothetical protein
MLNQSLINVNNKRPSETTTSIIGYGSRVAIMNFYKYEYNFIFKILFLAPIYYLVKVMIL